MSLGQRVKGLSPRHRTAVKAIGLGALAGMVPAGLGVVVLRWLVGTEPYQGSWTLGDQLAAAQVGGTLLTLALAVGFGVYAVEQVSLAHTARDEQHAEEMLRLREGLGTVLHSLAHNRRQLSAIAEMVGGGKAPFEPQLDTATWQAVQGDVMPLLHDPALAARIAIHFAHVASVSVLVDRYFEFTTGLTQAVGGSQLTAALLRQYIQNRSAALRTEAAELEEWIRPRLEALSSAQ